MVISHGRAYLRALRLAVFKNLGWMLVQGLFGLTLGVSMGTLFIH
jgi:hypothetical protein